MRVTLDIPQAEVNKMVRQVRAWQAMKRAEIIDLIEETARAVAADAKNRAPVESGDLKKKIRSILTDVASHLAAHVVADVFYAKFIELGTSTARAHPFMLPAYEAHVHGFLLKLRTLLSK